MTEELRLQTDDGLPLRDVVFRTLRGAILEGTLRPGERLMEIPLSEQLGVSRTPVREAIRMLELEGLACSAPRRGAMVASITEEDMRDVLEVREALEVLAVKLACRNMTQAQMEQIRTAADQFKESLGRGDLQASARADARFHEAICLATRNRRLIQLLNNIREQIFRYRLEYLKGRENYGKLAAEHERILTALAGKKEQEAADAAALHIANQRVSIMEQLRREKEEKR